MKKAICLLLTLLICSPVWATPFSWGSNYQGGEPDGGGSGAPTDATYITQTANGDLSAEQALGSLSTGVVTVTTTTGVLSSVVPSTSGNVLTSNGTAWTSAAPAGGGVGGSTGATDNAVIKADGTGGSTVQSETEFVIADDGDWTTGANTNVDIRWTVDKTGSSLGNIDPYIEMDTSENTWMFSQAGYDAAFTAYRPLVNFTAAGTDAPGILVVKGNGTRGSIAQLGGGGSGGWVAGHYTSGTGTAMYLTTSSSVLPATTTTSDNIEPTLSNGGVDLGSSSYRWNNIYSEAGNFSGAVTTTHLALTPTTVASLGTATAGLVKMISNAADATDCTTGGGSTYNLCIANGSAWIDA
jgi:hypothetical protein